MSPVSRSRTKKSKSKSKPAPAKGARRSGNPAVRAGQSAGVDLTVRRPRPAPDTFSQWTDSAEDVLNDCDGLRECRSALAVENAAAAVFGAELVDQMHREAPGLDPLAWLAEVTEVAADCAGDLAQDPVPALLLYAIAAFGTPRAAEAANRHLSRLRPMLGESTTGAYPWLGTPARSATPTGAPMTARNIYGDRWMVAAPFAIGGLPDTAHWYCWDIDACDIPRTAAAAVFDSAPDALAEWRTAVGPSAAKAELESTTGITVLEELLSDAALTSPVAGFLLGDEPAQLLGEHFRSYNRATALLESLDPRARDADLPSAPGLTPAQTEDAADRFTTWCLQHGRGPLPDRESVVTLAREWLTGSPARRRYACSPHRIRVMVEVLIESYTDEQVQELLALFPDWVAWCAEQTGLDSEHAERALATARQIPTLEAFRAIRRPEDYYVRIVE